MVGKLWICFEILHRVILAKSKNDFCSRFQDKEPAYTNIALEREVRKIDSIIMGQTTISAPLKTQQQQNSLIKKEGTCLFFIFFDSSDQFP
jgi:hypothetical protein